MSQENLKEVEIVTQRIEEPQEQNEKVEQNPIMEQNDSQSDNQPQVPEEKNTSDPQNRVNTIQDINNDQNQSREPTQQNASEQKIPGQQNTQEVVENGVHKSNSIEENSQQKDQTMMKHVQKPSEIKVETQQYEPNASSQHSNSPAKKSNLKNSPHFNNMTDSVNEHKQMQNSQRSNSQMASPANHDPQNSQRKKSNFSKQENQEDKGLFDDDDDDQQKSRFPQIEKLLDSNIYQTFITVLTIYALFGDDIRVMATTKSADIVFDVITIITLIIFFLEIVLAVISRPGYVLSFFFWLDVISTISLLIDIQLLSNQIFYGGDASTSASASQLAQAGKASRVGTKAGRVVRLVRLIRIVKLYKLSQEQVGQQNSQLQKLQEKRLKKKQIQQRHSLHKNALNQQLAQNNNNNNNGNKRGSVQSPQGSKRESVVQVDKPPQALVKESRVSKRLSDLTTKRVIVIVLLLLFIMPLFTADYYFDPPSSIDFATKQLQQMSEINTTQDNIETLFAKVKEIHKEDDVVSHLVFLQTPFSFLEDYEDPDFDEIRVDEQDNYSYTLDLQKFKTNHSQSDFSVDYNQLVSELEKLDEKEEATFQGILTIRSTQITTAGLSFGRTIFVCIVLTCGALFFTKDANDLALRPIERLIDKVNKIAKNPISAKEQKLVQEEGDNQLETIIIENAIIKIGVLLALGFGDAGSEIIGSNMQKSGDVDPMIPGTKKCAIYGFCDIRNFTDATEVLQEDVMLFVNNIGEVVHSMTDRYQGAANKNIGDAFLLVWKIPMHKYNIKDENNEIVFHDIQYINKLADMAILSFMKIQVKLNREPKILKYREDKRLQSRMKNYKVRLGYGLHIGWGIEGAIGSEFKIDASYLSPNVNMAARLEAATKQFGTPILISSALQELFTPEIKAITRYIDRVTVKGSNQPIGLYTVDQVLDGLAPSKDPEKSYEGLTKQDRQEIERQKKREIQQFLDQPDEWEWDGNLQIQDNKDLRMATPERNPTFYDNFRDGFQAYLDGKWEVTKQKFDICKTVKPDDGPMMSLIGVMQETNFKAPKDWPGYRVLTEK